MHLREVSSRCEVTARPHWDARENADDVASVRLFSARRTKEVNSLRWNTGNASEKEWRKGMSCDKASTRASFVPLLRCCDITKFSPKISTYDRRLDGSSVTSVHMSGSVPQGGQTASRFPGFSDTRSGFRTTEQRKITDGTACRILSSLDRPRIYVERVSPLIW